MIFLISMPLPRKIGVFVVPGRQKSTKNRTKFKKKNDSQKTRSRTAFFFRLFFGMLSGTHFSAKVAPIEPTGVQNGAKMPPKTAPEGAQDAIL